MKNLDYIKRSLQLYHTSRRKIALIIIIFLLLTVISMSFPFLTESLVDDGFAKKNLEAIVFYSLSLFGLYFLYSLLTIWKESLRVTVSNVVKRDLWTQSVNHLLKIKLNYYSNNNSNNIYSFLEEDIDTIAALVGEEALGVVSSILIAVGGAISLSYISWKLSLLILIYLPLKYVLTTLLSKYNALFSVKYIEAFRDYGEWFGDFINGISVIRFFNKDKVKLKEFQERQDNLISLDYKRAMLMCFNEETQEMLIQMLLTMVYLLAGVILYYGGISLGGIIAFEAYALTFITPISDTLNIIFSVSALIPSMIRYFKFIDEDIEEDGELQNSSNYDIKFSDVYFSYDKHKVLEGINLDIPQGEKIVILGENGEGKTTIINLLLRVINPDQGVIEVGNTSIDQYNKNYYRKVISTVSQNVYLFNDTIRNNLCLGMQCEDKTLIDLLNKLNLQSLIEEKTLDFKVGQNGSKLSGGQKQKIAIARAILHNSPILILDEATSNLDRESITVICNMLSNELKDKTVICITHDKEVWSKFDKVYKLDNRKIELL